MSDHDETLPLGIKITALDADFRRDPYPILERLRRESPVLDDTELVRRVYTRHDDVKAILRDKELLSDPRSAAEGSFTREYLGANMGPDEEPSMLLMDEPGHRRLRSLVSKPFTPAAVEKWRPRTRAVVQRVLDAIKGDEFDLIADFAGPIPTIVFCCGGCCSLGEAVIR